MMNFQETAHLALRIVLGTNIAAHGLCRIGSPLQFADALAESFSGLLPEQLVWPFGAALPLLELAIGTSLLVGLRLQSTLFAGMLLIAVLTLGSCLQEQWESAGLQLVYALAYGKLLEQLGHARFTLDELPSARAARTVVTTRNAQCEQGPAASRP